ncbi:MAG: hypothetical protein A2W26_07620 [Acidobacteria bacterium RBG_16_64_8]|nr:MAG: hypothetical protein A2W26_07620 [Acidobacteria bacterium RBG_16_64_8]
MWVDGWFLGEESPDSQGVVRMGAAVWSTHTGDELVVRARLLGGPWGPPWRSLIPGAEGQLALSGSAEMPGGAEHQVIGHAPAAGHAQLEASWGPSPFEVGPLGTPFVLWTSFSGPAAVNLDDSSQRWFMEAGRDLDVYF